MALRVGRSFSGQLSGDEDLYSERTGPGAWTKLSRARSEVKAVGVGKTKSHGKREG